jgi:phage shock protein C
MELKMQAQDVQPALPLRNHTILGVCEAIGEDFGFNPVWLRVPFAASVLGSPTLAVVAYFGLGAVVLLSRLLFPAVTAGSVAQTSEQDAAANEQDELARAA